MSDAPVVRGDHGRTTPAQSRLPKIDPSRPHIIHDGSEFRLDDGDFSLTFIAHGRYGHVSKWSHKNNTSFTLAVKEMPLTEQYDVAKRLQRDVEINENLNKDSPFIVKSHGSLLVQDKFRIFMEFMDTDLDRFCYKMQRLKIKIVNHQYFLGRVAFGVVSGLHYLKDFRYLHRDVKPDNILLSRDGSVKLCDFGLGVALTENSMPYTAYGMGSKLYQAPERVNDTSYDERADVWSLGATLLEIATGRNPYAGIRDTFAVSNTDAPQLLEDSGFSVDFRNFVNRCLVKEYTERPFYMKINDKNLSAYPLLQDPFVKEHDDHSGTQNVVAKLVQLVLDKPLVPPIAIEEPFARCL